MATILVSCCLDRVEAAYDDFTERFILVLARARAFQSHTAFPPMFPNEEAGFSNEVGLLSLLAFVALKCRAHAARLDALDLLRKSRWRDGPWDGVSLVNAVGNLMQFEGPNDEDGGIGISMLLSKVRYVWTNTFCDFEHRRMTMEYTKTSPARHGDLEKIVRLVHS